MENPVERLLVDKPLSVKQIRKITKLPKRTVMYHIFNSKHIIDVDPMLYGSLKKKINVYKYTEKIPEKKQKYVSPVVEEEEFVLV
jgi:DNA-binding transcriptional ArsR family regulator